MTNLFRILLFAILLLLIACKDENLEEEVVGDWSVEAIRITDCDDPVLNFPWTDTTPNECLVTNEFEFFVCIVSVEFKTDGTADLRFASDGDILIEQNFYTVVENKAYLCLNENDMFDVCDVVSIEDGKLFYEVANIGGQDCPEEYRLTSN